MDTFSIDNNKIAAETISELSKNAAAAVAKKLRKAAKDAILKGSIDFGSAFRQYLTASKERCEKIRRFPCSWTKSGWLLETIYSGIMLRGTFLQSTRGNPKELNRLYLVVSYPNGYYASLLSISYSLLGLSF